LNVSVSCVYGPAALAIAGVVGMCGADLEGLIKHGLTSALTQYRLYGRRFLKILKGTAMPESTVKRSANGQTGSRPDAHCDMRPSPSPLITDYRLLTRQRSRSFILVPIDFSYTISYRLS